MSCRMLINRLCRPTKFSIRNKGLREGMPLFYPALRISSLQMSSCYSLNQLDHLIGQRGLDGRIF
jgi:hypothetical protein